MDDMVEGTAETLCDHLQSNDTACMSSLYIE